MLHNSSIGIILKFRTSHCLYKVMIILKIILQRGENDSLSCNLKATPPYLL
nr:MAG TPA: hypothetical protein [Caudoviricetes sp.]